MTRNHFDSCLAFELAFASLRDARRIAQLRVLCSSVVEIF